MRAKLTSFNEFAKWRASKAGLEAKCLVERYDPEKCGTEFKKLVAIRKKEAADAWEEAMLEVGRKHADVPLAKRVPLAEALLVQQYVVPPHWNRIAECLRCGELPMHPKYAGQTLESCAWCHVVTEAMENV